MSMRAKHCEECACWCDYPNQARKRPSGWCCIDDYINIDNRQGYKQKTHCIRKDIIFGFIKEKKNE